MALCMELCSFCIHINRTLLICVVEGPFIFVQVENDELWIGNEVLEARI